ncbi:hypothetical protein IF803_40010 [Bradyrhizobium sp. UFLA06-06]
MIGDLLQLVPGAMTSVPELYPPPGSVLGIAIMRIFGVRDAPSGPSGWSPSRAALRREDLVLHAISTIFCRNDHRTAADRDQQIGLGLLGLSCNPYHHIPGGVLRNAVEGLDMAMAEAFVDLLDLVGRAIQRLAGNQIDARRAEPFGSSRSGSAAGLP